MNFFKQICPKLCKNNLKILFGGAAAPPDPPNYAFIIFIEISNSIVRTEFSFVVRKLMLSFFVSGFGSKNEYEQPGGQADP